MAAEGGGTSGLDALLSADEAEAVAREEEEAAAAQAALRLAFLEEEEEAEAALRLEEDEEMRSLMAEAALAGMAGEGDGACRLAGRVVGRAHPGGAWSART
eukprot:1951511-Prymnesium_polylepis.1